MATRHQARLAAISLLYSKDMNGDGEDFADEYLEEKRIRNEQRNWTLALLRGASENLAAVDALIDENLKEFKLAEISALERAILRLGAYELRFTDTDAGIVINEAINSAKELGISPRFINGVLDALKDSPVNIAADKISKPTATASVNPETTTEAVKNFKPAAAKNFAISDTNVAAKNFIPAGTDGETKNFTKTKRSGTPKNSTASRSRPSKKPANLKTRSASAKKSEAAASKKFKTERNFKTGDKFRTEKTGKNFKTGERSKNFKAGERGKKAAPKKESADRNFRASKSAAPKKGAAGKNTAPKSSAGRKGFTAPKKSAGGRGAVSKRPAGSKDAVRGKDKR
jgi:transcription antitermination factor nusB